MVMAGLGGTLLCNLFLAIITLCPILLNHGGDCLERKPAGLCSLLQHIICLLKCRGVHNAKGASRAGQRPLDVFDVE